MSNLGDDIDDSEEERREAEALFRFSEAELLDPDFDGKLKPILEMVFLRVFDSENSSSSSSFCSSSCRSSSGSWRSWRPQRRSGSTI